MDGLSLNVITPADIVIRPGELILSSDFGYASIRDIAEPNDLIVEEIHKGTC